MHGRSWTAALLGIVAGLLWQPASGLAAPKAFDCVFEGRGQARMELFLGGKGFYGFDEFTALCVGGSDGIPTVAALDISSSGTFTNTICGTGSFTTTSTPVVNAIVIDPFGLSPGDIEGELESADLSHRMEVVGGVGTMTWTAPTTTGAIGQLAGVVAIGPNPVQPPSGDDCTDGISAAGSFTFQTDQLSPPVPADR